jgi:hypothetical protein
MVAELFPPTTVGYPGTAAGQVGRFALDHPLAKEIANQPGQKVCRA